MVAERRLLISYCESLLVVTRADAGAQPEAVVVEAEDTVVASVAVGGPWWPEDLAGLTKLHLVHCGAK